MKYVVYVISVLFSISYYPGIIAQTSSFGFPSDSATWVLKVKDGSSGNPSAFVRYSSYGDTLVNGMNYHKVYRQWVTDYGLLDHDLDTIRFFMRTDSNGRLFQRFVDSINVYGTEEIVLFHFDYEWLGAELDSRITYPLLINNEKKELKLGFGNSVSKDPNVTCQPIKDENFGIEIPSIPITYLFSEMGIECHGLLIVSHLIGARNTAFFSVDFDKIPIKNFDPYNFFNEGNNFSCPSINKTVEVISMNVYTELNGSGFGKKWYSIDFSCLKLVIETGLNEPLQIPTLTIFPNPANNLISISYPETIFKPFTYQITSSYGHVVQTGSINKTTSEITVNALQPGHYVFSILNNEKKLNRAFVIHR